MLLELICLRSRHFRLIVDTTERKIILKECMETMLNEKDRTGPLYTNDANEEP